LNIHKIQDCSNEHVISILKEGLYKFANPSSIANYHPDYINEPSNLFYILSQPNNRYTKGNYYVLEQDDKLIACAGWNEYELDTSIALVMTRLFVCKEYRTSYIGGHKLLPIMLNEIEKYNRVLITVNKHNKLLYDGIVRYNENPNSFFKIWPKDYLRFKPMGLQNIYYTDQYILELEKP
jgi:hypothetical protein